MNRRTFIGTLGKLAAIVGIVPHIKAGEAKDVVEPRPHPFDRKEPEWASQYLLEPNAGEHNLDTRRFVERKLTKRDLDNLMNSIHKLPPC